MERNYKTYKEEREKARKKSSLKNLIISLDVNEMSLVFTDVVLSIFSKHIDNKIITTNNKDAPWITPTVKSAIRRNTRVYEKWVNKKKFLGIILKLLSNSDTKLLLFLHPLKWLKANLLK